MKQTLFLILILCGIIFSCERDNSNLDLKESLDTLLVIGDPEAVIISNPGVCPIDLDLNDTTDFSISVYRDFAEASLWPMFTTTTYISCLTNGSRILFNDTVIYPFYPEKLELGDSLLYSGKWCPPPDPSPSHVGGTRGFVLFSHTSYFDPGIFKGNYVSPDWYGVENKYLGLMLEKDDHIVFGWIKLSITTVNGIYIHEIGSKKAAYSSLLE